MFSSLDAQGAAVLPSKDSVLRTIILGNADIACHISQQRVRVRVTQLYPPARAVEL